MPLISPLKSLSIRRMFLHGLIKLPTIGKLHKYVCWPHVIVEVTDMKI